MACCWVVVVFVVVAAGGVSILAAVDCIVVVDVVVDYCAPSRILNKYKIFILDSDLVWLI